MAEPPADLTDAERTARYWGRDDLVRVVLDALEAAGKDLDALGVEDLAATDQFHGGGRPATLRLAELAGLHEPAPAAPPGGCSTWAAGWAARPARWPAGSAARSPWWT
ncbi:MAG: hypothetical protein R2755_03540 [Acidimicrobiales bacterium]